jgi:undecaprenyl diphosphate synthase
MKKIAQQVEDGQIMADAVNADLIETHLETNGIPDPELLIRTSGEYRISNFLLWQIAYSELYFTSKCWPDFRKDDLYEALLDYQNRERRFGKISEQIKAE